MDGIEGGGWMENREEVGWNTGKGIAGIQGEGWIEYREKDECNTGRRLGGIQGGRRIDSLHE